MDASCFCAFLPYCTHDRVTKNVPQTGKEKIFAERLLEISQETHGDCGIKIYHIPYLPRRIYIEAPGIVEIQELMKFSVYGHLVSRATRILDDIDRKFLHGTVPDVPCPGSWVRIIQACIYKDDLALVLSTPREGDVVSIAVVPRFNISQNKKRKGGELFARAAPAAALLDKIFLGKFPPNKNNIHVIGSRMFLSLGLELLRAPSAHALKIEPCLSEAELLLFRSCFERVDGDYGAGETGYIICCAVKKAFRNKSRRLWHTGDRVRILEGAYKDTSCFIHKIDEDDQSAIVEFGWPNPTCVEVSMEDLERQFFVGDQVRVALGENKGRTGSILEINDDIGTIVEGMANQLAEVTPLSLLPPSSSFINYFTQLQVLLFYLESHTMGPSFATTHHPAASRVSKPKPSHESEAAKGHQTLGGRESRDWRIGREAAVYVGHMKGYQGRLVEIGRNFGKIECPGRQLTTHTALLNHLVLM